MKDITNLKDLEEREHALGGSHWIAKFQNGYGASVIRTPFSYGGNRGLYELAVLDSEGCISYNTDITDDVMGYLTLEDVNNTLLRISKL